MAIPISRNPEELQKLYQGFKDLQVEAGRKSNEALTQAGAAQSFEQSLRERINARELSPELRKREQEAISQLFAVPEEVRGNIQGAGGAPVAPSDISGAVAGRMNNYFDLLNDVRDQRKSREQSLDDIIKNTKLGIEAQTKQAEAEARQSEKAVDDSWREFAFWQNKADAAANARIAGTQTERDRGTKKDLTKQWTDYQNEKLTDPDWTQELNGTDPDFYIKLLKEAEDSLGDEGREWFLDKFDPTKYVIDSGNNWDRMKTGGVGIEEIASLKSTDDLVKDLLEDLDNSTSEQDLKQIKLFYDSYLDLTDYEERIKTRLINNFGDEGLELYQSVFTAIGYTGKN